MKPSSVTPEFLRTKADRYNFIFEDGLGAMLADAIEIADSSARSDIECNCEFVGEPTAAKYDVSDVIGDDDWSKNAIAQAVRYLDARGLIERDPGNHNIVSFKP